MIAEQAGRERTNSEAIERWSSYLEDLHARIAHRFSRTEVTERVRHYLGGLLDEVRRKDGWQMAEAIGEVRPRGVQQHLLNDACWDADAVCEDLRSYIIGHLGEEQSGVLIIDETGFLKKGKKSVGVARRYTGTAGKKENAQVGVFLCHASRQGAAFIDRELYLPREWSEDPGRLSEAGVSEEVGFATKGNLAKGMLGRAFEAGVPARWVVADTVYGNARGLRGWLEARGYSYVLAVAGDQRGLLRGAPEAGPDRGREIAQRVLDKGLVRGVAREIGSTILGLPGTHEYRDRRLRTPSGALVVDAPEHCPTGGACLLPLLRPATDPGPLISPDSGQPLADRRCLRGS